MNVTVKINTDTPAGKRLEAKLRLHPECVEFIESTIVSEPTPTAYGSVKDVSDKLREHVNSISASESAKLAFQRLGEKYNRTFDNKYTR